MLLFLNDVEQEVLSSSTERTKLIFLGSTFKKLEII